MQPHAPWKLTPHPPPLLSGAEDALPLGLGSPAGTEVPLSIRGHPCRVRAGDGRWVPAATPTALAGFGQGWPCWAEPQPRGAALPRCFT